MQTGFESPLARNDRARVPAVAGILVATFAVGLATGILLSRVSSDTGQTGVVTVDSPRTTTMIDAWRLAIPAVAVAPVVSTRMLDAWRLGAVPAVTAAPAVSDRIISSWIDVPALAAAPAQSSTMIDAWRLAGPKAAMPGR